MEICITFMTYTNEEDFSICFVKSTDTTAQWRRRCTFFFSQNKFSRAFSKHCNRMGRMQGPYPILPKSRNLSKLSNVRDSRSDIVMR